MPYKFNPFTGKLDVVNEQSIAVDSDSLDIYDSVGELDLIDNVWQTIPYLSLIHISEPTRPY